MFLFKRKNKGIDTVGWKGIIVVVLNTPKDKKRFVCKNIITNAGDIYYAQKGVGETPANNFTNLYLGSTPSPSPGKDSNFGSITLISDTNKALETGYPKTNDTDSDNGYGGANVVTRKYAYGKADFAAASITEGIIATATASGTDPVLCHFAFPTPFEKTSNDTLVIFVNHKSEGV